ncbi:MAG TPA: LpxD N-terminal domain-containing protein, partial [Tepidisphaeraceae bacterium]
MLLEELAQHLKAEVVGDKSIDITSAATLEEAGPGQISFLANPKYLKSLQSTAAAAVIVAPGVTSDRVTLLKTSA